MSPTTWQTYSWPNLRWQLADDASRTARRLIGTPRCLPMKTNPEDVISLVVGTELDTYTFDSGPIEGGWDGTICPVDAGDINPGIDGGPIDTLEGFPPAAAMNFALGVFKAVAPVHAGQIDIMAIVDGTGATGLPRYEHVLYPSVVDPAVGDVGSAWRLSDESIVFFPWTKADAEGDSPAQPPVDPDVPDVTIGSTNETEAAMGDSWSYGDGTCSFTFQTRSAYQDTGDEKWYGYYRTIKMGKYGRYTSISVETRVEIDAPEACA